MKEDERKVRMAEGSQGCARELNEVALDGITPELGRGSSDLVKRREYDGHQQMRKEELRKDWADELNPKIDFDSLTHGSNNLIKWRCHKCGYEWPAYVYNRWKKDGTGTGCPDCGGKVVSFERSLAGKHPELLKFIDMTAEPKVDPTKVVPTSDKIVTYVCGKGHRYPRSIASLVLHEGRCRVCAGQGATEDWNLAVIHPEITAEWHPTENNGLTPYDFTPYSDQDAWWQCPVGHDFSQKIEKRTNWGQGCPKCKLRSSRPQNRVCAELKSIFDDVQLNAKVHGFEVDVWIPSQQLGIEIDGNFYHRKRLTQDRAKTRALTEAGVQLIRLREDGLPSIDGIVVSYHRSVTKQHIDQLLSASSVKDARVSRYIAKNCFQNEAEYRSLNAGLRSVKPEDSLASKAPDVAAEWDYDENSPILPVDVSYQSNEKYHFICPRCGESYKARVDHRTGSAKSGCECNRGRFINERVSLLGRYPEIAAYCITEEGQLEPSEISPWDKQVRTWKCPTCGKPHYATTRSKLDGYKKRGAVPGCRSCAMRKPRR